MLSYCLKGKKDAENVDSKMVEQCYHQNVLYATVKNQDL